MNGSCNMTGGRSVILRELASAGHDHGDFSGPVPGTGEIVCPCGSAVLPRRLTGTPCARGDGMTSPDRQWGTTLPRRNRPLRSVGFTPVILEGGAARTKPRQRRKAGATPGPRQVPQARRSNATATPACTRAIRPRPHYQPRPPQARQPGR